MKPRHFLLIVAFVAFNCFQISAQTPLKTGSSPVGNNLFRSNKPTISEPYASINNPIKGARTTTASPLTGEVQASYSTATTSYMAYDSTGYSYSKGRGYNGNTYLFDDYYYLIYIPHLRSLRYLEKQSQTFDISNNILTNLTQQWDTVTSSWGNLWNNVYTYDATNNLIASTFQAWNATSSAWSDYGSGTYTYDGSGNQLTAKEEVWDSSSASWINAELYTYTYDSRNNMLAEIYQLGNKSGWTNYTSKTYTYDARSNKTSEVDQSWDTTSSSWKNVYRYIYTYNSTNKNLSEVDQSWNIPSSSWVNVRQSIFTYTASDDLEMVLYQSWSGGSWQNFQHYIEKFNSTHDDTDMIIQLWDTATSTWDNDHEDKYTYDANHDNLIDFYMPWDTTTSTFIYNARYSYTYNSNYQILTGTEDEWNSGGYWRPSPADAQARYYYETYTGVNNINNGGTIKFYPIPANNIMNMDLNWNTPQSAVATIYNMQGMLCRQWQIPSSSNTHHSIPVAQLPAGNYILKITGEKGQLSQQVSVVH